MAEEHVPVRLSHLLRDCSVGAIVRGPDSLMVVQDIRSWDRPGADPLEREIRYVDRVRSALGIDKALCSPPRAVERDGTVVGWIPALRFPTWMRCRKCGLLHPAPWRRPRSKGGDDWRKCTKCRDDSLEQTPWVLVHEDGYLADVPWHDLAHRDSRNPAQRQCSRDWEQPYLKLDETGVGRRIRCLAQPLRCRQARQRSTGRRLPQLLRATVSRLPLQQRLRPLRQRPPPPRARPMDLRSRHQPRPAAYGVRRREAAGLYLRGRRR